jgi:hypothetical protein
MIDEPKQDPNAAPESLFISENIRVRLVGDEVQVLHRGTVAVSLKSSIVTEKSGSSIATQRVPTAFIRYYADEQVTAKKIQMSALHSFESYTDDQGRSVCEIRMLSRLSHG